MDKPKQNRTYALTAPKGEPCIANGNTWAESEVQHGALTLTVGQDCPIDVNKLRQRLRFVK
tara:strand:- start:362 stop:544 length:183 start_codon:yes stop_codon:yes gene_type:complete